RGDHQIARLDCIRDMVVRHVESSTHLDHANPRRRRRTQHLVGNQNQMQLGTLGGAVEDVFDYGRASVGVDPDPHRSDHAKNASVRTSMLWRGGAPGGVLGSSNDVCGVKRARPSLAESYTLKTIASSRRISGK